jgi:hypothetical protein
MGSPLAAILTTADLVAHEYGVRGLLERRITTPAVNPQPTQILQADPQRLLYLVANISQVDMIVAETDQVSVAFGYKVFANGGLLTRKWRDDLTTVTDELWAVMPTGPANIYVVEWRIF